MTLVYQHLRCTNDKNGNPRRLYCIYDTNTGILAGVYDEGYSGKPDACRDLVELPSMEITLREYHSTLRYWSELENRYRNANGEKGINPCPR